MLTDTPRRPPLSADSALDAKQRRLAAKQERLEAIEAGTRAVSAAMADAGRGAELAARAAREAARERAASVGKQATEAELATAEKAGRMGFEQGISRHPMEGGEHVDDAAMLALRRIEEAGAEPDEEGLYFDVRTGGAADVLGSLGKDVGEAQAAGTDVQLASDAERRAKAIPARPARTPRSIGGPAARVADDWVESAAGTIIRTSEISAALPAELRKFAPQFDDLAQVAAFVADADLRDTGTPAGRAAAQAQREQLAADMAEAKRRRQRRSQKRARPAKGGGRSGRRDERR